MKIADEKGVFDVSTTLAAAQAVVTTAAEADTTVQATTVPATTEAALDRATPVSTPDLASALAASASLAASKANATDLSCSWMKLFTSLTSTMPSAIAA